MDDPILLETPTLTPLETTIPVVDTELASPMNIGTDQNPRASLFPAVSMMRDENGVENISGVLLYAIIPGIHYDKLFPDAPRGRSLDGFPVLGYRDELLECHTGGAITIIPVARIHNNQIYPLPIAVYPGDTSLQTAAKLATNKQWNGVMPFAITGANDPAGRILPNSWSKEKRKYLKSFDVALAGNSDDCDIVVKDIPEALAYLKPGSAVIKDKASIKYVPSDQFLKSDHKYSSICAADDQLSQIMSLLQRMDARLTSLEQPSVPVGVVHHPTPNVVLPSHTQHERKAVGWLNVVDSNYPGTWDKLDQFADRDTTGRKFTQLLNNSTPSSTVGPTQQQNQHAKALRLYNSMAGMGLDPNVFDLQWIISNGVRGPTVTQIEQFKAGHRPDPSPTATNSAGGVKMGSVTTRVETSAINTVQALNIARNALSAPYATESAVQRVVEYMAENGGKGLNQVQMLALRNEFKPKGKSIPQVSGVKVHTITQPKVPYVAPNIVLPPVPPTPPPRTIRGSYAGFRKPTGDALD